MGDILAAGLGNSTLRVAWDQFAESGGGSHQNCISPTSQVRNCGSGAAASPVGAQTGGAQVTSAHFQGVGSQHPQGPALLFPAEETEASRGRVLAEVT